MSVSETKWHVHEYDARWKCVHCEHVLAPELRGDRSLGNTDQFPEARP